MPSFSDRMQAVSERLVKKYGTTLSITRKVPGTFNPVTQKRTGDTESDFSIEGVIEDYRANEIANEVRYGDKKVIIYHSETENLYEPLTGDIIEVNDKQYRVVAFSAVFAQDNVAAYEIQIRGQ